MYSYDRWMRMGRTGWALWIDSSAVMALRISKLLSGHDPSGREARLMITEKIDALAELHTAFLSGRLGADPASTADLIIAHYNRKVRANRRRLCSKLIDG